MPRVFDDKELLERIDNDWEFLTETVQMLSTDGPVLIEAIRRSVLSGDAAAAGRAAHSLKGMVSNFCSPITLASAFEVEKLSKSGDLFGAPQAVKALEDQVGLLTAELNQFLATRV
jgi:HPt (histidine-containing phosphotransfer) domain-containing protein